MNDCVTIEIVHIERPPAADLPSHLFPGCGDDFVEFRVVEGNPTAEQVSVLVLDMEDGACVTCYDSEKKTGGYVVVDDSSSFAVGYQETRFFPF